MSQPVRTIQTDVVIAGSGPGGATMARELSKKGKKVVLCEAGKNHQWLGKNSVLLLGMMDKMGMTFSKEGTWVLRPKTARWGFGGLLRHGRAAARLAQGEVRDRPGRRGRRGLQRDPHSDPAGPSGRDLQRAR